MAKNLDELTLYFLEHGTLAMLSPNGIDVMLWPDSTIQLRALYRDEQGAAFHILTSYTSVDLFMSDFDLESFDDIKDITMTSFLVAWSINSKRKT